MAWRRKKCGTVTFWHKAMVAQLCLKLAEAVGPPIAEGRGIAARPQATAIWHNEQSPPPCPKRAGGFIQERRRIIACLKPMQHHQAICHPF